MYNKITYNKTTPYVALSPDWNVTDTLIFFLNVLFFFFLISFILFLAALGLHCCTQAFSSCGKWGLRFVVVRRLLNVVASLDAERGL